MRLLILVLALICFNSVSFAGMAMSREMRERLVQRNAEKKMQQQRAASAVRSTISRAVPARVYAEPEYMRPLHPVSAQPSREPAEGFRNFLGPYDGSKRDRIGQAGYVNQGALMNANGQVVSEGYHKVPGPDGSVEGITVKRDPQTGDVTQIVHTIENPRTGALTTNLIDYNEKTSSHCTNLKSGVPGASTQCSTISSSLCTKFNNVKARSDIMPVHYRAMSSQLSQVKRVKVKQRSATNALANEDQQRCNSLAANLEGIDRVPASDPGTVHCMACGCPGSPCTAENPAPPSAPEPAAPEAPATPSTPPPSLWSTR